jgi:hypothetical protein
VASGATLAPGVSIGTLTFNSALTLNSGSVAGMDVNRAASPNSDRAQGITTFTAGGTLSVTNLGAPLEPGDAFELFSASSYAGEFGTISPANPNNEPSDPDLAWDTPHLKNNGVLRVHRSPNATNLTIVRAKGLSAKVRLSELFPVTDGDGDPVVLVSFTGGSQGATITTNATHIFYAPANDNNDGFNYTVADNRGGARTRTVTVNVVEATGQAQSISVGEGAVTVNFAGIPGYQYSVERATNVEFTENVTSLSTNVAPTHGLFSIVDANPPSPTAYYRLKYNP